MNHPVPIRLSPDEKLLLQLFDKREPLNNIIEMMLAFTGEQHSKEGVQGEYDSLYDRVVIDSLTSQVGTHVTMLLSDAMAIGDLLDPFVRNSETRKQLRAERKRCLRQCQDILKIEDFRSRPLWVIDEDMDSSIFPLLWKVYICTLFLIVTTITSQRENISTFTPRKNYQNTEFNMILDEIIAYIEHLSTQGILFDKDLQEYLDRRICTP